MMNSLKLLLVFTAAIFITSCKGADGGYAPSTAPLTNPSVPTALAITPAATTLSVNNNFNFIATGGSPPYSYSIVSGGGIILTVVDVGQFAASAISSVVVVQLSDSLGAIVTATVTVNPALQISPISQTIITNSLLILSATGGVLPYAFSVSAGAGSVNASTGLYTAPASNTVATVLVTDAIGNTSASTVTVTSALSLSPVAVILAVSDTQAFIGSGGMPPLVYSIVSGGGSINSSTGAFTAPATAGSVTVRVTDALAATANSTVIVNPALTIAPASITLSVNGSLTFSAAGGVAPRIFTVFSGGGSINASTGAYTAPATAGSAVIRVTDSLGHTANSTLMITNALGITPAAVTLAVSNTQTFSAVGGSGPFTYSIVSGGGAINASTGAFTAPATAGSVTVRVTDSLAATATATVTVNAAVAISPASVTKAANATHTFSATGGVTPYVFSILSGGGSINSSTGAFTAPATAGAVTVRVTDALSNVSNSAVTVVSALAISPAVKTLAVNNVFSFAGAGGQTPYTYSIFSGGGIVVAATGSYTAPVIAGSAVVRVTDAIGQTADSNIIINGAISIAPASLSLGVSGTQTFSATGGVSPYSYSIFSGGGSINASTGAFIAPATAGSVVVRVTDSLSNTSSATVIVNPTLAITPTVITLSVNNVTTFSVSGGVSPYTYSIFSGGGSINASTGAFIAPATAGSVVVRVTDSLSNTSTATVTVVGTVTITPATKSLAVNNAFTFSATGGLAPYSYSIFSGAGSIVASTGAFTAPATAGSVVVRVTDALSQISGSTVTINAALAISPAAPTLAVNGTQTFSASGGVSPYTYSIFSGGGSINASTGAFTAPATAGSVVVRVTDSLSNTSSATVAVNPALAITPTMITLSVNNVTTFSATGGVSPYTYFIFSGGGGIVAATGVFTAPATAGSVVVRVTDSLSNTSSATVTVTGPLTISPAAPTLAVNGTQTFSATGGVSPYTYSILSGGGSINASTGAFIAPAVSSVVTVRVSDSLSNISDSTVTVNGPLAMTPTTLTIVANGAQTFVAAGGVAPYTYSIVSGTGTIDPVLGDYVAGPAAGADVVRVTDSALTVVNVNVTVYDALTLSPTLITLAVNGTQTFTATGGSGVRTFAMVSGGGSINASTGLYTAPAVAGSAVIKVTDSLANTISANISIVSTLTISPQTLKLPVFSTATFTSVLGTTPYSYSIFAGTGSVVAATGVYTGGSLAGTDTVRVTDAALNTSNAIVTLIVPVQIISGSYHTCVRYNDGSVKCWGLNSSGQLGLGDTTTRGSLANQGGSNLPFVNLGTGRTAKGLAAGYTHTCAILDNNSVKCWGLNSSGQLGQGDTTTRGTSATTMGDGLLAINLGTGRTALKIAAGNAHTCAILDDNTLKCWGANLYGQLGRDNTTNVGNTAGSMGNTLLAVNLGVGFTAKEVSAGLDHTCVILDNNTLKCFGRNDRGQLGYDSTTTLGDSAGEMAALATVNLGVGRTAVSISNGYSFTCALLDNGLVKCWGRNQSGQLGLDSNVVTKGSAAGDMASLVGINLGFIPTKISASRQRACAMNATTVKCWGLNTSGQLLIGSTTNKGTVAGDMASLTNLNLGTSIVASDISSGWYASCVITTNKRIKCFGSAVNGYLQNASITLNLGDVIGEVGNGLPFVNH